MMDYGMGWGMGSGGFGMLLFWLVPLLVVIVLAAAAIKYLIAGGARSNAPARDVGIRALEVLEERYARGEINREEYLQKRDDLKRR